MKKTLIASAVAAATLSTSALAMDQATDLAERLDSMPTFYGNIQVAYFHEDEDDNGAETSSNEFADGGSTFGIKHEHAISDDLTGFLKAEFHFDADDNSTDSGLGENMDEAYIGVKGGFGSVQVGSDDTVFENMINITDISEQVGISGDIAANKEGDNVQYVSPTIGGGLTVGVTYPIDSDTTFGGEIAAGYEMDNLTFGLGYSMGREEGAVEAGDTIGLSASIGLDALTVQAQYETRDEDSAGGTDLDNGSDYMALQGIYAMGQNQFALGYAVAGSDVDGSEDSSTIFVQALHNMSDNMYVYLEYATTSDADYTEGKDVDNMAIGATYAF